MCWPNIYVAKHFNLEFKIVKCPVVARAKSIMDETCKLLTRCCSVTEQQLQQEQSNNAGEILTRLS